MQRWSFHPVDRLPSILTKSSPHFQDNGYCPLTTCYKTPNHRLTTPCAVGTGAHTWSNWVKSLSFYSCEDFHNHDALHNLNTTSSPSNFEVEMTNQDVLTSKKMSSPSPVTHTHTHTHSESKNAAPVITLILSRNLFFFKEMLQDLFFFFSSFFKFHEIIILHEDVRRVVPERGQKNAPPDLKRVGLAW